MYVQQNYCTPIAKLYYHNKQVITLNIFMEGKSCLTNLLEIVEYCSEEVYQHNQVACVGTVYLQYNKGFVFVPMVKLLEKLYCNGIAGKVWARIGR